MYVRASIYEYIVVCPCICVSMYTHVCSYTHSCVHVHTRECAVMLWINARICMVRGLILPYRSHKQEEISFVPKTSLI